MLIFFLTSGLFLGWSLGANDASNVFGPAVGSKLITFRTAAIVASIAMVLGAVLQGSGTSMTLNQLGSVNAVGGSFTVALAAAITAYMMIKLSLPVSTTQAIVGAIIGWNFFIGNKTNPIVLGKIASAWVLGPILGAIFSIALYAALKAIKKRVNVHLIRFESFLRGSMIVVGAFCAYSLGANNIANVMGVFIPSFNLEPLKIGIITLSSKQQLFLLGGISIVVGIATYSKKVMKTLGNNLLDLTTEAALVVTLAQSLVLFIFSSTGLSNFLTSIGLPPIPMVAVSSSQVIVGCIMGIGIYKGIYNINFKLLGGIALGWITTPVIAGVISYLTLFFMRNTFNVNVGHRTVPGSDPLQINSMPDPQLSLIFRDLLLILLILGVIVSIYYFLVEYIKYHDFTQKEKNFWETRYK